jgi:hypothetical protein
MHHLRRVDGEQGVEDWGMELCSCSVWCQVLPMPALAMFLTAADGSAVVCRGGAPKDAAPGAVIEGSKASKFLKD